MKLAALALLLVAPVFAVDQSSTDSRIPSRWEFQREMDRVRADLRRDLNEFRNNSLRARLDGQYARREALHARMEAQRDSFRIRMQAQRDRLRAVREARADAVRARSEALREATRARNDARREIRQFRRSHGWI